MNSNNQASKHSILLVDDEPEILFSLKGLLRREFNLFSAASGEEALEILRHETIHVVMTDQRMPEMTGVELMKKVKSERPDAIRIVFTGYADIKAVVDAINSGGLYRYITKPWDPDELVDLLHQAASEYDAVVERQRLLKETHQHLAQGMEFARKLMEVSGDEDSADIESFLEQATQLQERITHQQDRVP